METQIKINNSNDELFCTYSKERIHIGEKYVLVQEETYGEVVSKPYKLEAAPSEEDFEEPYIGE